MFLSFGIKSKKHTRVGKMEPFVYQLVFLYIIPLRFAQGVLTLNIIRHSTVEAKFICNQTQTFTDTMSYIETGRSGDFSPCFCLLYPKHGLEWPPQGTVTVTEYDLNHKKYEVGTIGFSDTQTSEYSAAQIEYGLRDNVYFVIVINSGKFGYYDATDYFRFVPTNVKLDLSCSPHGYWDPRRTTSAPSTHAPVTTESVVTEGNQGSKTSYVTTEYAGSEGAQARNTVYIIIGSVVAGVVLIVILVVIICLMRRAGVICSKAGKTNDKQKHTIDNNNAPDGTVSYVNAGNMNPGNDGEAPVEYAQVDVSLLSKRPMPEQNVSTADEETAALTYADLDFDNDTKTNKSPEKVAKVMESENKEETNRSGIYVNKLHDDTRCGTESQHAADDEKDLSELYAKPMKKPTLKLV